MILFLLVHFFISLSGVELFITIEHDGFTTDVSRLDFLVVLVFADVFKPSLAQHFLPLLAKMIKLIILLKCIKDQIRQLFPFFINRFTAFYHQILMITMLDIGNLHVLINRILYLWQRQLKILVTLKDLAIIFIARHVCHSMYHLVQTWVFLLEFNLIFN